jgi:O-antigen/teichoic acid export membrane protein
VTGLLGLELAVLLIGCGLTATLTVLRAGLPSFVSRADAAAETRSASRRFLIGLLNGPVLLLLAMALGSKPDSKPLALVVLMVLIAIALWGLAGQLPRLGRRVLALGRPRETSPLAETLTGGAALTGAFLLPFVGWIAFGAVLLLAVGTGVSALFLRRQRPPAQ